MGIYVHIDPGYVWPTRLRQYAYGRGVGRYEINENFVPIIPTQHYTELFTLLLNSGHTTPKP